jgi:putative lipoic acid-binding regulatory protein
MTNEQETPLMTFPCDFVLKVMGEDIDNYADTVLKITQLHIEGVDESCIQIRPSRNGKYIAVSIQLVAHSREQLDKLYLELNAHKHTRAAL